MSWYPERIIPYSGYLAEYWNFYDSYTLNPTQYFVDDTVGAYINVDGIWTYRFFQCIQNHYTFTLGDPNFIFTSNELYWERVFPNNIIWDGRFVWVVFNKNVALIPYEMFDHSDYDDILLIAGIGSERIAEYLNPIHWQKIKYFNNQGGFWVTPYLNGAFISQGQTFSEIKFFDYVNNTTSTISCPFTMNSNLLCCDNKLWMTEAKIGGDQLHIYDIATQIWTQITIPVREQLEPRHLSHDKNGHVLITNYNDWSLSKFNVDGTFSSTIFLDDSGKNKQPTFAYTHDSRTTYVISYNGMISTVDTSADTCVHFANTGRGSDLPAESDPQSTEVAGAYKYFDDFWGFESDGTYLWISTNGDSLIRMELATQDVIGTQVGTIPVLPEVVYNVDEYEIPLNGPLPPTSITEAMDENYTLVIDSTGSYKKVITIPEMTKQVWNGSSLETKTYKKQIGFLTDTGFYVFPNDKLWRPNTVEVEAVAMVSSGPYDYTGD